MSVSRRYDLLGCYCYIIHLCGFRCLGYLLALYDCAYRMHVVAYGCAMFLFPVAVSPSLRCPLETCLCMPLYVGLELLIDLVAFGVLGALFGGVDSLCTC